jgi:hypothetical protein
VADSLFAAIVQDDLRSVTFNVSGVELRFGDACFTAHVWPTVSIGDATWAYGDHGYRDALCAFISHEVAAVEESQSDGLVLRFALGSITTNPELGDLSGPEIAQLAVYDPMEQLAHLAVWRVGEGPFSRLAAS